MAINGYQEKSINVQDYQPYKIFFFKKQNQLQRLFPTTGPSMVDTGCPFIHLLSLPIELTQNVVFTTSFCEGTQVYGNN